MTRRRLLATLLLVPTLGIAKAAEAQLAVAESGPMTLAHVATAVQQTANTLESIYQSAQWFLEMSTYISNVVLLPVAEVQGLLMATEQVLWDIQMVDQNVRLLFNLDGAPMTPSAMQERLWTIRRVLFAIDWKAWQIQTLPRLVVQTLADIQALFARILHILGSKQGSQQMQVLLVKLNETQSRTEVVIASANQADLAEKHVMLLIEEGSARMSVDIYASWPRMGR